MDVKLAFLNGCLEEEIIIEKPKGFPIAGQENQVYQLKSLICLKTGSKKLVQ